MARKGDQGDRGLFQRDGVWWIRWTCPYGHDHKEKIGTAKSTARDEYQRRRQQVRRERYCLTEARAKRKKEQSVLFQDAATRYLAWAERECPRSLKFRQCAMTHLLKAFGPTPLPEITRAALEAYLESRRVEGAAPATVNRERSVLGHLFKKASALQLASENLMNPIVGTKPFKEPDGEPRPLTYDEEARLLPVLPAHYLPFVTLALHTGLRLGELRAQLWKDIDLEQGTLTVTRPKSKRKEYLPLNQTARRLLTSLERTGPLVFPAMPRKLSDLFICYAQKAGLAAVTFHCLRDTFISRLAPHVSEPFLMALARHRDYRTTLRYLKPGNAHLLAAVERLSENGCGTGTPTGTEKTAVSQLLDSIGITA